MKQAATSNLWSPCFTVSTAKLSRNAVHNKRGAETKSSKLNVPFVNASLSAELSAAGEVLYPFHTKISVYMQVF